MKSVWHILSANYRRGTYIVTKKESAEHLTCRANFTTETKRSLAAAAGHRCSYKLCIEPTTLAVRKKDKKGIPTNNSRPGGVGVAAHIYGATQTGCPRPSSLTPEELSHESNGIWMCHTHGTLIDQHEEAYSASFLKTCKEVREFAHSLTITSADIKRFHNLIPALTYESIIWKYNSNLLNSIEMIEADALAELGKQINLKLQNASSPPLPPEIFKQTSISIVTHQFTIDPPVIKDQRYRPATNATIRELVESWSYDHDLPANQNIKFSIDEFHGAISAKDELTGAISPVSVSMSGRALILIGGKDTSVEDTKYLMYAWMRGTSAIPFTWNLAYGFKDENHSTLKKNKDFNCNLTYSQRSIEETMKLVALLKLLVDDWTPIGLFGLRDKTLSRDTFQNKFFEIGGVPDKSALQKMLRNAQRALYPIKIKEIYDYLIDVSEAFFDESLTDEMIDEAFEELRNASSGSSIPFGFISEPCFNTDEWKICLVGKTYINGFFLGFRKLYHNSRLQLI